MGRGFYSFSEKDIGSGTYELEGGAELVPARFVKLNDVGLLPDSNDRLVKLIQQSYEEGQRKGTRKAIHRILTIRFNADPNQYHDQLNRLDLPTLKILCETALTAPTLVEFEAALTRPDTTPIASSPNKKPASMSGF